MNKNDRRVLREARSSHKLEQLFTRASVSGEWGAYQDALRVIDAEAGLINQRAAWPALLSPPEIRAQQRRAAGLLACTISHPEALELPEVGSLWDTFLSLHGLQGHHHAPQPLSLG